MIEIVNRNPSGMFDAEESWIRFTEANDSLIIKPATPVLGVTSIRGFSLETEGALAVTFRYSLDEGLNWSEPQDLSDENLQSIEVKRNHWLSIEVTLVNLNSGESYFKSVSFDFSFEKPSIPDFYKGFNYSEYIPYYNHFCIDWTLNVLQKIYRKGIVPKFIERSDNVAWDDEDYINFWYPIIYISALRIWMVDVLNDMLWNPKVLHAWLESKGLILGSDIHMDELYYLMIYFYDEMMRRGTLSAFDRSRELGGAFADATVRGEFMRLINGEVDEEAVHALIPPMDQGWIVGYSSTCGYINTDYLINFTKAWENRLTDISRYPLYNGDNVSMRDGQIVIAGDSAVYAGIGLGDPDMRVSVDPSKDYYFLVVFSCSAPFDLRAGCNVYNNIDDQISLEDADGNETNYFVEDKTFLSTEGDILFFGEIRAASSTVKHNQMGRAAKMLKFPENTTIYKAMPFFVARSSNDVVIKEVRFGLLADRDTFISSIAELYLLVKNNNSSYDKEALRRVIEEKLLPVGVFLNLDVIVDVNLSVAPQSVTFPYSGGQESVQIMMDVQEDWVIFKNIDWVTASPEQGMGSGISRLTAEENVSRNRREGYVDVRSGSESVRISVIQLANLLIFELTSDAYITLRPLGGSFIIRGNSNCQGIKIAAVEWMQAAGLKVNGEPVEGWDGADSYLIPGDPGNAEPYAFEIEVQASVNEDSGQRTGMVTVEGWDEDVSRSAFMVNVLQWGADSSIQVDPEAITIPSDGTAQEVNVITTGNWTATEI